MANAAQVRCVLALCCAGSFFARVLLLHLLRCLAGWLGTAGPSHDAALAGQRGGLLVAATGPLSQQCCGCRETPQCCCHVGQTHGAATLMGSGKPRTGSRRQGPRRIRHVEVWALHAAGLQTSPCAALPAPLPLPPQDLTGKFVGIWLPISAFAAIGCESGCGAWTLLCAPFTACYKEPGVALRLLTDRTTALLCTSPAASTSLHLAPFKWLLHPQLSTASQTCLW